VVPQRQSAFKLASEIEKVSLFQSRLRRQEILFTQEGMKGYLRRVAAAALILGAVVAVVSIVRTRSLEAGAERHLRQIERNAADLRRLSLSLSKAQEDERKSISRELHDQVGQMLTALRMELGNIEDFRLDPGGSFDQHMAEARKLVEETVRTVRDMSMGLRPSVLDELGLGPALKWHAREFTRRSGVPVELQIDGSLDRLDDTCRTCVYRVVQEALTNCARHAGASEIRITLHGGVGTIALTVEDNGVGFDVQEGRSRGLGLLGAEERVKELGGKIEIFSQPSKGTLLRCSVPTSTEAALWQRPGF
jgi:signal transduction histidine kinase